MPAPNRISRLSQFWLPGLLFFLSLVSILFTLRNDEIPVLGPNERPVQDSGDIDSHRLMINQALHRAGSWRNWCEHRNETMQGMPFKNFDSKLDDSRWADMRRNLPQREQDALLRCHNASLGTFSPMTACVFLVPKAEDKHPTPTQPGLYLVEMSLELRANGRKKTYSCAEALASTDQSIELVAWYSYYAASDINRKPIRFDRLTGGTRIFPPHCAKCRKVDCEQPTLKRCLIPRQLRSGKA